MKELDTRKANARLVRRMLLIVVAMFGFGFALVPIYNVFCAITGLNGKVGNEAAAIEELNYAIDQNREVTVEFVTSLNENMPLDFRAATSKIKVHPGQFYTVKFFAENQSDQALIGQAIPSIAPGQAAEYFKKTECFCFTKQTFEPGKEKEMPVRFVVDPALPDKVKNLTLAYTFFDVTGKR